MAGVACTHVAKGWIGGVLYSQVARNYFGLRGSGAGVIYVGLNPTYVMWLESPSWVDKWFESSLLLQYGDSICCSAS
jgi:hypothetical protein